MEKNILFFIIGATLMLSVPILAMNNHGSGGNSGNHNSSMAGHTGHMTEHNFDHGSIHHQIHDGAGRNHTAGEHMMDTETAQRMIRNHMDERSSGAYHLMNFKDTGSSYCTDVYSHEGKLMDRLIIDKNTGKIRSSLKE